MREQKTEIDEIAVQARGHSSFLRKMERYTGSVNQNSRSMMVLYKVAMFGSRRHPLTIFVRESIVEASFYSKQPQSCSILHAGCVSTVAAAQAHKMSVGIIR